MAAIVAAAALNSPLPEECPSLMDLSIQTYIEFLEEECSAYVTLTHLDSPILNPVKDRMMLKLKEHLSQTFENLSNPMVRRDHSGMIRTLLIQKILNGRYPSEHHRNSYNYNTNRIGLNSLGDDDDTIAKELDSIKLNGRKCSSVCCTGAFLVETMLCVLVNEDVTNLEFGKNLKDKIYRDKPIVNFLFFDLPSVLVHYIMALNAAPEGREPALQKLIMESCNLGSLSSQSVFNRMLKAYKETKKYIDFPWKLSLQHSRPTTQFMMLTLGVMFDRPPGYFRHLTQIQLSGECLNTRLNVSSSEGRGQAPAHLMSCIAQSCSNLEIFDLSNLSSLSPECLVYLCYKDAFHLLHKYMYLPKFSEESGSVVFDDSTTSAKHDGKRYCPWCEDPALESGFRSGCSRDTRRNIYVLDDRLYEYIETFPRPKTDCEDFSGSNVRFSPPPTYLSYCVKISDLIHALTDDLLVLDRLGSNQLFEEEDFKLPETEIRYNKKAVDEETSGRSELCYSMKELRLPADMVDSKAWVVPLFLHAMPHLTTLGNVYVYDGLKIMKDLPSINAPERTNIEEIDLYLEDFTSYKVHERSIKCIKSLVASHTHWSTFCSAGSSPTRAAEAKMFSLERFVAEKLPVGDTVPMSDTEAVKQAWRSQIQTVAETCPMVKTVRLTIQPFVLSESDKSVLWRPLSVGLPSLNELHVTGSCWADVVGLLLMIGHKLETLNLMLNTPKSMREDDVSSMEFVNTIPHLCPNLKKVSLGHRQGERPHSLCTNDVYNDEDRLSYKSLTHFEAAGSITYTALSFLWQRATNLQSLRITNSVVQEVGDYEASAQPRFAEVILSPDRIENLFRTNKMSSLKILDVPLTLSSISSATKLLDLLPLTVKSISLLQVKVAIPESGEGNESIGDLVAAALRKMVEFKLMCKRRCAEQKANIRWSWRREGILTILLQQQIMISITELIDP